MPRMIFVNLPVKDIAASTRFYEAIGCTRNEQFSDEKASSMVWSETITFQLLQESYFSTFVSRPIADARETCQVLLALSMESRAEVDALAEAAARNGGRNDIRERWISASCIIARSRTRMAISSRPPTWI